MTLGLPSWLAAAVAVGWPIQRVNAQASGEGPPVTRIGEVARLTRTGPGPRQLIGTIISNDSAGVVLMDRDAFTVRIPSKEVERLEIRVGARNRSRAGARLGVLSGAAVGLAAGAIRLASRPPRCRSGLDPCPPYWTVAGKDFGRGLLAGASVGIVLGVLVGTVTQVPIWRSVSVGPASGGGYAIQFSAEW